MYNNVPPVEKPIQYLHLNAYKVLFGEKTMYLTIS